MYTPWLMGNFAELFSMNVVLESRTLLNICGNVGSVR